MGKNSKRRITAGGHAGNVQAPTIILQQTRRGGLDVGVYMKAIRSAEVIDYPRKEKLCDLYEDVKLDSHLFSVLRKQKAAVLSAPIQFMRDGKVDEAMQQHIKSPWFLQFLGDLVDHEWEGVGGTLFQFFRDERGWIDYTLVPRKHFDAVRRVILRHQGDITGESWDSFDDLVYIGDPRSIGNLAVAAFWVILKRNNVGDWADFAEIFGRPIREGTYSAWDEEARRKLVNDLAEMGGAGIMVHPDNTRLNLVQAQNVSGGGDLYEKLGTYCNNEISKAVTGNTLTTEAGDKGTQALGTVQKEGEEDINFFIKQGILNILNYEMTETFARLGIDTRGGEFFFVPPKSRNTQEKVNILKTLRNEMQLPIEDDYLYEEFGIPKPKDYEAMKEELRKAHSVPAALSQGDDDKDEDDEDGQDEDGPAPKPDEDGKDGGDGNQKPEEEKDSGGKPKKKKGNAFDRLAGFFVKALQGSGADLDW